MVESGSSMGCYQSCPRLRYYKYEMLLDFPGYSPSLDFGTSMHGWLEKISGVGRDDAPEQELAAQKSRVNEEFHSQVQANYNLTARIAVLYQQRWSDQTAIFGDHEFTHLDAESEFSMLVGAHKHVGKRDGLVRHNPTGKIFLLEHKTATAVGMDTYFNRLEMDRQISSGILALRHAGIKCDGALYNVIFKPAIRLLTGRKTKPDETVDEFHDRMVEAINEDKQKYFQRSIIYRTDQQLENHLSDLHHVMAQIEQSQKTNAWPRNTGNCDSFGRLCGFFSPCLGGQSEADLLALYRVRSKKLPELSEEIQK